MRCKECDNFYKDNDKYAGGRCRCRPKKTVFPDDHCVMDSDHFKPIKAKEPETPTDKGIDGLPPDPQEVYGNM